MFSSTVFAEDVDCPHGKSANARKHFEICTLTTRIDRSVLLLDASIFYGFSEKTLHALESGVPITVQLLIEFYRERDWMWDESIATLSQRYRIQYHALTHKYVITNVNSKARQIFSTRSEAMAALSQVVRLPVLDKKFIVKPSSYYGRAKVRLMIGELPSPLRLWAYMSSDWRLKSEWYQWPL